MNLILDTEKLPLRLDDTGTIRVGPTRVTLDTLVAEFHGGATPEQIAQDYPSLSLADIYSTIGFYLRNQEEIHAYLTPRRVQADQLRRETELRHDPTGIRERLLARRAAS